MENEESFIYSAIYVSNLEEERRLLWTSLSDTFVSFGLSQKAWMVNGPRYTWSNHRSEAPIAKKLDRCLVNGFWLFRYPVSHCSFESPDFSDHSPGLIRMTSLPPLFGEPVGNLRDFCFKLKQLKRPLKTLLKENFSDIERRVAEAGSVLSSLQMISLNDPSESKLLLEAQAKEVWIGLRAAEESFFKQKSRIKWLGEGDLNTRFIHSVTTTCNAQNSIKQLLRSDGTRTSSLQEVHELAVEYFRSFLTTIRGRELEDSVLNFFESNFMLTSLNSTSLVLIPKRPGAEELKDFRPIACLNTVYKVITKLLSERLKIILPKIILSNQTAFVKDRLLLENVLLASELMHGYHREGINSRITLKVDISKAFDSGLDAASLNNIQASFNLKSSSLPIRYLGLPLSSRKLSVSDCDSFIALIKKKLDAWTNKLLSLAGRLTLLSSVISGIIGFWTSAFILPKKVLKRIESLSSSFLWHGRTGCASRAKVAWKTLSYPKSEGGLGLKDIESWNNACGLKLLWMLFFRAGSIWVAWIRSRYLSSTSFWALNERNSSFSWMFRKILHLRSKAMQFLTIKIGRGDSTFFWWDPWTPFGSLRSFLGDEGTSLLGIPISATVSDLWNGRGWTLPPARTERQLLLLSHLSSIGCSPCTDCPIWSIGGSPQRTFSLNAVWNVIRPTKPEVSWASLLWHKAGLVRHQASSFDNAKRLALLQGWQGAVYELWKERNRRMHDGVTFSPGKVFHLILSSLMDKCRALTLLGSSHGDSILQLWMSTSFLG
ncbi:unnamed protein product [Microthlaspi erraticum]|uniref:Reverse transcriptase domain-containing protein n=1 Tax=Microthlaspi erraticum TaxID=1685480 RepID=A0A6D2I9N8_9BRAS|nr:unnamed protein product [Microthlaspi erraticum]